jgi:hypothetical protein
VTRRSDILDALGRVETALKHYSTVLDALATGDDSHDSLAYRATCLRREADECRKERIVLARYPESTFDDGGEAA